MEARRNRTADDGSVLLFTASSTSIHAGSAMFQHLRAESGADLATDHATQMPGEKFSRPAIAFCAWGCA